MTLPVPNNPVRAAGSRVTASTYGSDITDAVNFLANPPVFFGYQTSVQSLANNTPAALLIDTEVLDLYGGHSNVTNSSRYTVQRAGYYLVMGTVTFASNATGVRAAAINLNGGSVSGGFFSGAAASGGSSSATAFAVMSLAVNDYVELLVVQTSGGSLNTAATNSSLAAIWIHA